MARSLAPADEAVMVAYAIYIQERSILRRYAALFGLDAGFNARLMRATFIAMALSNGASLEKVQRKVG